MKNILLILVVAICTFSCKAQTPLSTKSKKATKAYNLAIQYMDTYQYELALAELAKAKKEDPNFVEAYMLQANLHMALRQWNLAEIEFKKSFELNPNFFPAAYYDCAQVEMKQGKYEAAKADYQTFLNKKRSGTPQRIIDAAEDGIASCDFAIKAMANPVPFKPVNMGASANSAECEYFPNVTADDNTFLFTRNAQVKDGNGVVRQTQEDFFISYKGDDGKWSVAQNMGSPINTAANEGAPSLSADGRYLYFAACEEYNGYGGGRQGFGSCDIFFTQKVNAVWTAPVNVGAPVNTSAWESQPSFSSDGKTLYYISNRRDGYGSSDIWMCSLDELGKWGKPTNLGTHINTAGKEEAVFIHPDNQTLYFASDGLIGMGGLDLYICRRDSLGNWGNPVNLGYPINTYEDESGLIVNSKGDVAYFSSTRDGTLGCDDIYMFEIPVPLQPVAVTYMKGKVYDAVTKKPLAASFELMDLATGKSIISSVSDPVTGEFLVCIPQNKNYALSVNRAKYLPFSESFWMQESINPGEPYKMDVPLQPILVGTPVVLKNVYFDVDKFDLKSESTAELNNLVKFLNANPQMKIEIGGHTDSDGDKKHNQTLSENRAKSVYNFLIAKGITADRLTYKGYGDTKPLVANDSPANKKLNRRTEFKVIAIQ